MSANILPRGYRRRVARQRSQAELTAMRQLEEMRELQKAQIAMGLVSGGLGIGRELYGLADKIVPLFSSGGDSAAAKKYGPTLSEDVQSAEREAAKGIPGPARGPRGEQGGGAPAAAPPAAELQPAGDAGQAAAALSAPAVAAPGAQPAFAIGPEFDSPVGESATLGLREDLARAGQDVERLDPRMRDPNLPDLSDMQTASLRSRQEAIHRDMEAEERALDFRDKHVPLARERAANAAMTAPSRGAMLEDRQRGSSAMVRGGFGRATDEPVQVDPVSPQDARQAALSPHEAWRARKAAEAQQQQPTAAGGPSSGFTPMPGERPGYAFDQIPQDPELPDDLDMRAVAFDADPRFSTKAQTMAAIQLAAERGDREAVLRLKEGAARSALRDVRPENLRDMFTGAHLDRARGEIAAAGRADPMLESKLAMNAAHADQYASQAWRSREAAMTDLMSRPDKLRKQAADAGIAVTEEQFRDPLLRQELAKRVVDNVWRAREHAANVAKNRGVANRANTDAWRTRKLAPWQEVQAQQSARQGALSALEAEGLREGTTGYRQDGTPVQLSPQDRQRYFNENKRLVEPFQPGGLPGARSGSSVYGAAQRTKDAHKALALEEQGKNRELRERESQERTKRAKMRGNGDRGADAKRVDREVSAAQVQISSDVSAAGAGKRGINSARVDQTEAAQKLATKLNSRAAQLLLSGVPVDRVKALFANISSDKFEILTLPSGGVAVVPKDSAPAQKPR